MSKQSYFDRKKIMDAAKRGGKRAMGRAVLAVEREMKTLLSGSGGANHTPADAWSPPHRQHGELRSSVQGAVFERGGKNCGVTGATARYAKVQDQGTVGKGGTFPDIVPRSAKALAVPVDKSAYGKRPRDIAEQMKYVPIKNRGPLVALLILAYKTYYKKGQRGTGSYSVRTAKKPRVMFALMTKVAIAPHPFTKRALSNCRHPILAAFRGMLHT